MSCRSCSPLMEGQIVYLCGVHTLKHYAILSQLQPFRASNLHLHLHPLSHSQLICSLGKVRQHSQQSLTRPGGNRNPDSSTTPRKRSPKPHQNMNISITYNFNKLAYFAL